MVQAKLKLSRTTITLTVDGHAGSDEIGRDLICAAASMAALECAQVVKDKAHLQTKVPKIALAEGKTKIVCYPQRHFWEELYISFSDAITGYKLLAHNYPDYVAVPIVVGNIPYAE